MLAPLLLATATAQLQPDAVPGAAGGAGGGGAVAAAASPAPLPASPAPLPPPSPPPKLPPAAVPAARAALAAARAAADDPAGVTVGGLFGLTLEEEILMARLAGHEVRGTFDALGSMPPSDRAYWAALDAQLELTTRLKHMFESTWYRCGKLSNGMPERYPSLRLMEEAALRHVLAWLGLR